MHTVVSVEKLRAELREVREFHGLVRVLDLSSVEYVIEDRREAAQSPECLKI
jgi:hypothetical protein